MTESLLGRKSIFWTINGINDSLTSPYASAMGKWQESCLTEETLFIYCLTDSFVTY